MLKVWARLVKDNKIINNYVVDVDSTLPLAKILEEACKQIAYELDLSNPIIQTKHIREFQQFRLTKFLPESFIESVEFDRLEINLFEEKPNNKK